MIPTVLSLPPSACSVIWVKREVFYINLPHFTVPPRHGIFHLFDLLALRRSINLLRQ